MFKCIDAGSNMADVLEQVIRYASKSKGATYRYSIGRLNILPLEPRRRAIYDGVSLESLQLGDTAWRA
jgi:hypothetical protein